MHADYHAIKDGRFKLPKERYQNRLYRADDIPDWLKEIFTFTLPAAALAGQSSVLAFIVDPDSEGNMRYEVLVNDQRVASGHMVGGVVRGLWEIIGSNVWLPNEENTVEFRALPDGDSRGYLNFSDVLLWYKAE